MYGAGCRIDRMRPLEFSFLPALVVQNETIGIPCSTLILSWLRLMKTKAEPSYRSSAKLPCTMAARPLMDLRISTICVAKYTVFAFFNRWIMPVSPPAAMRIGRLAVCLQGSRASYRGYEDVSAVQGPQRAAIPAVAPERESDLYRKHRP